MYNVPSTPTLPPFPKNVTEIKEIEEKYDLQSIYNTIDKASKMLRNAPISEKQHKQIPTEPSLYMMYLFWISNWCRCSSRLLPYLHNHFTKTYCFDVFCSSIILPEGNVTKEKMLQSDVLLRCFLQDNTEEEIESISDEDKQILGFDDNQTSSSSISNDSTYSSKSIPKSQFMTVPSLSFYTSESLLDEDWNSFINQIPAYGSFSIVC